MGGKRVRKGRRRRKKRRKGKVEGVINANEGEMENTNSRNTMCVFHRACNSSNTCVYFTV